MHRRLIPLDRYLLIPNDLCSTIIESSLSNNLVASKAWQNLSPNNPVKATEDKNANTNDWERVVWVAIGVDVSFRWNKWDDCQEDIRQAVEDCDRQIGIP